MAKFIAKVPVVVRVDGSPVRVEPSTPLPDGVAEVELARLVRFDAIAEVPDEPATPPDEKAPPSPRKPRAPKPDKE